MKFCQLVVLKTAFFPIKFIDILSLHVSAVRNFARNYGNAGDKGETGFCAVKNLEFARKFENVLDD